MKMDEFVELTNAVIAQTDTWRLALESVLDVILVGNGSAFTEDPSVVLWAVRSMHDIHGGVMPEWLCHNEFVNQAIGSIDVKCPLSWGLGDKSFCYGTYVIDQRDIIDGNLSELTALVQDRVRGACASIGFLILDNLEKMKYGKHKNDEECYCESLNNTGFPCTCGWCVFEELYGEGD